MIDMFFSFLIMVVNVAAVLSVLLILKVFFGATIKLTRRSLIIVAIVTLAVNIVLGLVPWGESYTAVVIFAIMVSSILVLSASHRFKNCILAVPAALMYVQWGSLFSVIERLTGLDKLVYHYKDVEEITPLYIISDILLVAILLLIYRKVNEEALAVQFSRAEGILITIVCIIYPIIVEFFIYLEADIKHPFYRPFWLISMILVNLAVIYAVVHRKKSEYYKRVAGHYKDSFDVEHDSFEEYKETNSETAKFRHDWNNHMLVIQEMFAKGEYEKAKEYFSKLTVKTQSVDNAYVTGNEIVDMILKSKHPIMEEQHIRFTMKGNLSALTFMENVDCCVLFSNIIDNAIEANLLCRGERYIVLSVKKTKNLLYVQMDNPYERTGSSQEKGKTNGDIHGIGLQNAVGIIRKYGGQYSIEKNSIFKIKMCFTLG